MVVDNLKAIGGANHNSHASLSASSYLCLGMEDEKEFTTSREPCHSKFTV